MRTTKITRNLFFDAFKHFKNNISNLIFYELPTLKQIGPQNYFNIVSVNYKSKYPDMKKIGLIDYEKPSDGKFEITELGEKILEFSSKYNSYINRNSQKRLGTIGKSLYENPFYNSNEYHEMAKILLELELNYYDEAISIRPYFILVKMLITHKIKKLTDEILLDILSLSLPDALNLNYKKGNFNTLDATIKEEIKRPKPYILDFLKCSKIIDNSLNVTLDISLITQIILSMNEKYISSSNESVNEGRCSKSQLEFRNKLLEAYNFKCAITDKSLAYYSKISNERRYILDAAHIIPYADGGSFSVNNGILLSPEMHTLFDLGIISINYFGDELYCIVSQSEKVVGKEFLQQYHMKKIALPANKMDWPDKDALDFKQSKYFIS